MLRPLVRPLLRPLLRASTEWMFSTIQIVAPPLPMVVTVGSISAVAVNAATGKYYGVSSANGHYVTSDNGSGIWVDRVYSPSTYTPNPVAFEFDATNMYVYSSDGKIYRAALDVFNVWTEISVAARGPLTSGRPGSLLAMGSGVLLYGNYTSGAGDGAHIWRSADSGATWAEVLSYPAGKHVHAIRKNSATGNVWASLGDTGFVGTGLHKSADGGATWTFMSSNRYGIDMVFAAAAGSRPAMVVLEGDGLNEPHLVGFPETGVQGDPTVALVNTSSNNRGTARGIGLTPEGDVIYFMTPEGGSVGENAGIYIARGPELTSSTLLKDITGAEPAGYGRTLINNGVAYNAIWSFPMPYFGQIVRQNLFLNAQLIGAGAAPTSWVRPGATGTSAPDSSTLTQFSDGAIAYAQTATAQRPFLQQDVALSANTSYDISMYVEDITGAITANNMLTVVSAPAGAVVMYYQNDAAVAASANVVVGRLRAVIDVAGTAGTVSLRVGLGGTGAVTGTVRFSRPQIEARDFAGPYKPT